MTFSNYSTVRTIHHLLAIRAIGSLIGSTGYPLVGKTLFIRVRIFTQELA